MVMQKETIVTLSDLRYLNLECGKCHTQIILDLAGKKEISNCPVCHATFDPISVGGHVTALAKAFEDSEKMEHKFSFRITSKD